MNLVELLLIKSKNKPCGSSINKKNTTFVRFL